MQTVWVKCFRCDGKGYERNEIEGSYPCVQCDGVGRGEVDELIPEYTDAQYQQVLREGEEDEMLAAGTHYLDANGSLQPKTAQ
jgi:DnaJ-class molecular chaperone